MSDDTNSPALTATLSILRRSRPGWARMDIEALQHELDVASIMPVESAADMHKAAALALYIAERMTP